MIERMLTLMQSLFALAPPKKNFLRGLWSWYDWSSLLSHIEFARIIIKTHAVQGSVLLYFLDSEWVSSCAVWFETRVVRILQNYLIVSSRCLLIYFLWQRLSNNQQRKENQISRNVIRFRPRRDKNWFCWMRTTMVQIRLRIRAVWSASMLFVN